MKSEIPPASLLCYTIALDAPGSSSCREQAQLLVSSLLRMGFPGAIKIFHNGLQQISPHPPHQVEEIGLEVSGNLDDSCGQPYQVRHLLSVGDADWVLYLECHCLALSALDDWFSSAAALRYVLAAEVLGLEGAGSHSGIFAVRAEHFQDLMAAWEKIAAQQEPCAENIGDQSAWNQLLRETALSASALERPAVTSFQSLQQVPTPGPSVIYVAGESPEAKTPLMRAAYAAHFFSGLAGSAALTRPSLAPACRIFVVSLARIRSRRVQVVAQLLATGLEFEIVDAVDAHAVKPEVLTVPDDAYRRMSAGEVGCYLSHLGIYQRICDYDLDYAIVLEDDFQLNPASRLTLENLWEFLPAGADHVQLHNLGNYLHSGYQIAQPGVHFNRVQPTSPGTFGYLISQRLARCMLEHYATPRMAIDWLFIHLSAIDSGLGFYDTTERIVETDWQAVSSLEREIPAPRSSQPEAAE